MLLRSWQCFPRAVRPAQSITFQSGPWDPVLALPFIPFVLEHLGALSGPLSAPVKWGCNYGIAVPCKGPSHLSHVLCELAPNCPPVPLHGPAPGLHSRPVHLYFSSSLAGLHADLSASSILPPNLCLSQSISSRASLSPPPRCAELCVGKGLR